MLVDWNDTEAASTEKILIHRLVEAQAANTPTQIAIRFGQDALTYAQLNHKADCLAGFLRNQGVPPRTLIGLHVDRSLEMMVGLLGILKAGCCYVPLDPSFPTNRLSYMAEDAGLACLLTQKSLTKQLTVANCTIIYLDQEWTQIEAIEPEADGRDAVASSAGGNAHSPSDIQPADLAYVIYTSGSTGRPKGVQIPHHAAVNFLQTMAERPGLDANDILVAVTTLSFDIALLELILPLTVGAQVVIASREESADARLLIDLLDERDASVLQATPATWRMLFEAGWEGKSDLRALCGGEPFPTDLAQRLLDSTAAVWNMYGPTETTVWSTIEEVKSAVAPILIGRPIANTEIYILG